ncbi:hypothetical protein HOP62_02245 [Halomonas sp. MCCC 1A17488]|uniref:hypothetical protein n=1 Tax=unclassified Halomonas TaxID=2609666 RepID=UPI0018D25148|nr:MULTISPECIES: hypothetical protein [unclassified Halomonas]MCE8014894.1 hypothetical protein [Halomonas sp. MCCC 1A17488]MCG3238227.1 hypothetical protein [Halomonas sp. MCCC 1A17488]QPP48009.1 hypothetical protein I4484_12155 [Halomonas sp. SS10-MC5]
MPETLMQLAMAGAFGAFVGLLFRVTRRPGQARAFTFTLVGLAAGITAYLIFYLLTRTTGAPAWLLPLLVLLQVWLWLGPLGPKWRRLGKNGDEPR